MTTRTPAYSLRSLVLALVLALVAGVSVAAASASRAAHVTPTIRPSASCFAPRARTLAAVTRPRLLHATAGPHPRSWSYDWPVKPFRRQHPVRAFLDDPRIGDHGGRAFHFGIDISVPDGTPVYAVEAGTVYRDSDRAIAVVPPDRSRSFGYWHIVPAVKSHQYVARHELLGRVAAGWGHVHFAERRGTVYVNPLRPGGLGPYEDRTPPTVDEIGIDGSALVVSAHDTPDPAVPGAWAGEPVTPALLRWRAVDGHGGATAWRTVADFRGQMLDRKLFGTVYTRRTRQNHKAEPGRFCFYLAPTWAAPARGVTLQVEAADSAGNSATYALRIAGDRGL